MKSSPVIVFRLSSFGDVVLSTGALKHLRMLYPAREILFVTRKEYSDLLKGNPYVDKVVAFDKHSGFKGWIQLCLQLFELNPEAVCDLHSSTRTKIAKIIFLWGSLVKQRPFPTWKNVSKERLKSLVYYLLKRKTPRILWPTPWANRFSNLFQANAAPHIDLSYLLDSKSAEQFAKLEIKGPYVCVMPSSRWQQKEWNVENYLELLASRSENIFVLGMRSDRSSLTLFEKLKSDFKKKDSNRRVYFCEAPVNFGLACQILKNSTGFMGVDTGFFHLAESLNVKSLQILGPTEEGLGYGPRLPTSKVAALDLFCRPCSKNGKICYRFWDNRACLKKLNTDAVKKEITF